MAGTVLKGWALSRTGLEEDAIGYATARAKFGHGEIGVLNES
jgi:hypothetical protein